MPSPNFTVLTPQAFISDFREEASKSENRIWVQAMEVEPGKITDTFLQPLTDAAKRGVNVKLHADYYSLMVTDGKFNYLSSIYPGLTPEKHARLQAKKVMREKLAESGVQVLYTNPPTFLDRLFPVRGRNHMKIVIVDNICYLGGVNFHDENFLIHDMMVKITTPEVVSEVAYVYERIDSREVLRDMSIACTDETTLLIDGGRINHSIILRHAVELVQRATKDIKIISPIIPDAALLRALNSAIENGISVQVIIPETKKLTGVFEILNKFNTFVMKIKRRTIPLTVKNHMIHAKLLIIDEEEVLFGSHNLTSRGVRMGTEEIAVRSKNHILVQGIRKFYDDLVNDTL